MQELYEILRPKWGAEKWILEGFEAITDEEKKDIQGRIDDLFKNGLPIDLKLDKLFYIYTFSLLAQLEVLAIQIPLKFESKLKSKAHRERLHQQLLDEVFHGLVFTKIVHMLCSPYASPPPYNPQIEDLCNFIRNEDCPKVGLMLLNLVGEGWIEESFYSLKRAGIAPEVFSVIIEDEHRHVCEADLYRDVGMPKKSVIMPKIAFLEEQLLTHIFLQYKYMASFTALIGIDGAVQFKECLDEKHRTQLKKIDLEPTYRWNYYMQLWDKLLPNIGQYITKNYPVDMSPTRRFLTTQWSNPSDPTMVGHFDLDIHRLDFFSKKLPPEALTCLMLQTSSHLHAENELLRNYLSFRQLFHIEDAYVGLVVKLPNCGENIATIFFENCHNISLQNLIAKVKTIIPMMVYCHKKREMLEKTNPEVQSVMEQAKNEFLYKTYDTPLPGVPFVSLSNIGFCGYNQCKSPLLPAETSKFTLLGVTKKPVWNFEKEIFEPLDVLPVSASTDHRARDGNIPVPKLMQKSLDHMIDQMLASKNEQPRNTYENIDIEEIIDALLENSIEFGYRALLLLQTAWLDFLPIHEMISARMEVEAELA